MWSWRGRVLIWLLSVSVAKYATKPLRQTRKSGLINPNISKNILKSSIFAINTGNYSSSASIFKVLKKKTKKGGAIHCSILPSDFLLWSVAKNTAWSRSGSRATHRLACTIRVDSVRLHPSLMRTCFWQLWHQVGLHARQRALQDTGVSKPYMHLMVCSDLSFSHAVVSERRPCNSDAEAARNSKLIMILLYASAPAKWVPPRQAELYRFYCFTHLLFFTIYEDTAISTCPDPPFIVEGRRWVAVSWLKNMSFAFQFSPSVLLHASCWRGRKRRKSQNAKTRVLAWACRAACSKSDGVERSAGFKNT